MLVGRVELRCPYEDLAFKEPLDQSIGFNILSILVELQRLTYFCCWIIGITHLHCQLEEVGFHLST